MLYYFAYGMLTDPNAMGHNEFIGKGSVRNYEFEFRYFANVITKPKAIVWGTVWRITREELAYLDQVEGYPSMYNRVRVEVELDDGKKVLAEMYTLTPVMRKQMEAESPTKYYMQRVLSGYKHANLPMEQLTTALERIGEY